MHPLPRMKKRIFEPGVSVNHGWSPKRAPKLPFCSFAASRRHVPESMSCVIDTIFAASSLASKKAAASFAEWSTAAAFSSSGQAALMDSR